MGKGLPTDLCSANALGMIRQNIGVKEENFIANVCNIKDSSNKILDKFKEITLAQSITPGAPVDVHQEVREYNSLLLKIKNIADATQIRVGD